MTHTAATTRLHELAPDLDVAGLTDAQLAGLMRLVERGERPLVALNLMRRCPDAMVEEACCAMEGLLGMRRP